LTNFFITASSACRLVVPLFGAWASRMVREAKSRIQGADVARRSLPLELGQGDAQICGRVGAAAEDR